MGVAWGLMQAHDSKRVPPRPSWPSPRASRIRSPADGLLPWLLVPPRLQDKIYLGYMAFVHLGALLAPFTFRYGARPAGGAEMGGSRRLGLAQRRTPAWAGWRSRTTEVGDRWSGWAR